MTTETSPQPSLKPLVGRQLYAQLFLFFVTRTIVNSGFRIVYPFLPAIARGLGVTEAAVTLGITARSALGLLSPLIGSLADSWGRKRAMMIGIMVFVVAMLLIFISPSYPALLAALILTTLSKFLFDPAMYAYLGDRVDYRQRGLAVGIAEFGWSGAFLIGIPIAGFLIERASTSPPLPLFATLLTNSPLARYFAGQTGWNAPFPLFALTALGILVIMWRVLPDDRPTIRTHRPSIMNGFRIILRHPAALAGLVIGVLITASNEVVNVVYGSWMENSFAMQIAALGLASAIIGIAELLGEGLVAGFVDWLGKRRALAIGLSVYIVTCFLLPVLGLNFGMWGALAGLFLFYLGFEFTLVTTLPLMTELIPGARATFMATNGAGHSLGRVIGSVLGPLLFRSGLGFNALAAVVMNVLALALLIWFVQDHHGESN